MVIKIYVEKTLQETKFEPFKVALGVEHEVNVPNNEVIKHLRNAETAVENLLNEIIDRRLSMLEDGNA